MNMVICAILEYNRNCDEMRSLKGAGDILGSGFLPGNPYRLCRGIADKAA
jgi:hypothetical protein